MGAMTVGLVVAGVVVIGVVLLAMRWRSGLGEQQALRHYQHALDTLRTVSDRMESSRPVVEPKRQSGGPDQEEAPTRTQRGAVAFVDGSGTNGSRVSAQPMRTPIQAHSAVPGALRPPPASRQDRASRQTPAAKNPAARNALTDTPAPARRANDDPTPTPTLGVRREQSPRPDSDPDTRPALVFEEDVPLADPGATSGSGSLAGPTLPRVSRRALQRSSRAPSRVPMVLGVGLVVVIVAVVAVLASGLGSHHTTSPPPVVHHHTTAPVHHTKTKTTTPSTTATTAAPTVQADASTATPQGATYPAPAGRYTVMLSSTGPCWVYATLASTGAVLFTGTLDQGQAQALTGTGEIDVQLGHANTMTETLNGTPVVYPAQYQAVFMMKFVPTIS
jgi:hypothetical protein